MMTEIFTLRVLACIGFLCLAWEHDYFVPGPRPSPEYLFATIAAAGGVLILANLARGGLRKLRRSPDILVPFGCAQLAYALMNQLPWQQMSVNLLDPFAQFGLVGFILLLLGFCIQVAMLLWTTELLVQAATDQPVDLFAALRVAKSQFPRGALIILLAWVLLFAPLVLILSLALGPSLGFGFAVPIVGITSVSLNCLTIVWLPLALRPELPILEALRDATRTAWERVSSWAVLLLVWLAAVGVVTFQFSTTRSPGSESSSTGVQAHVDWLGGLVYKSHWYQDVCDNAKAAPEGLVEWPLQLLFLLVAVAAKIVILERLFGTPESAGDPMPVGRIRRRRRRRTRGPDPADLTGDDAGQDAPGPDVADGEAVEQARRSED